MINKARTRDIALGILDSFKLRAATFDHDVEETDSGHPAFESGCDDYSAFAFSIWIDGRQFYITVEDVTPSD